MLMTLTEAIKSTVNLWWADWGPDWGKSDLPPRYIQTLISYLLKNHAEIGLEIPAYMIMYYGDY